ncbi:response regulator transcription factor [Vitreimonas flagellata]|uniref:response regulator transcription factor n=1 Tax=Vitreimonas flagellata TaxID=2560861 RepID=UPI0010751CA1|nr:response regulator transcription factor [Vitreimonas flagellata]
MSRETTILIIDDDADLRQALVEQFDLEDGFGGVGAASAAEGFVAAADQKPAAIVLDVSLPDMDGFEACKQLRDQGVKAPIIMLTGAAQEEEQQVQGLDAGANDYVLKPFKFSVLLARIRAHLRSHEASEDAVYRIGPYEFRPAVRLLIDSQEKKIRLTDKEAAILRYLYRSGEKPVGRDELLREVWGYNANVTTHTLETHIYRLRQKIEPDAQSPKLLITETGGYRLQV